MIQCGTLLHWSTPRLLWMGRGMRQKELTRNEEGHQGVVLQLRLVLVRVSIAVMKQHDQKQVGEERVYLVYVFMALSVMEGSQDRNSNMAGTWRQELMQRPWWRVAFWLAP